MCGLCGMAGPLAAREIVQKMNDVIAHRGPDGDGYYQSDGVVFGHRRLKIIDLVTGDQPMPNEDRTIWTIYNGETYNFQELCRDLESKGHVFRSRSDTEVLVHLYEEYGPDFLSKLDGIFAFALWDERRHRLLLARDYFGVKPMYYYFDGTTLRFASEIKSILADPTVPREVDFQGLHFFLNLRYVPGDRTLFSGIRKVKPGHYLLFEDGQLHQTQYFTLQPQTEKSRDAVYYCEGIRHYLQEAVRKQLISDVPLGAYLSGGLDSSAIVAYMSQSLDNPARTFSLGFNEPSDELDDALIVARRFATDHCQTAVDADPLNRFPKVIWHVEEPKENILQGYLLAQFARQHVTVAHSGLGGDELFAGYTHNRFIYPMRGVHHWMPNFLSQNLLTPLSSLLFRLQNRPGLLRFDKYRRGTQMLLAAGNIERYYLISQNVWDYDDGAFDKLYGPVLRGQQLERTHTAFDPYFAPGDERDVLDQVLWAEIHNKMVDDYLMNEDRTAMAHGLEVRVPFLDRDLVQFSLGIPVELKMKGNETKYIFKQAMTGVLPAHTLNKKKWGFSFDPYYQFQKDLKTAATRILTRRQVEDRGWFNYDYLHQIIEHPPHPHLRWQYYFLWLALGLEIWCQMYLEGDVNHPEFNLEAYYSL